MSLSLRCQTKTDVKYYVFIDWVGWLDGKIFGWARAERSLIRYRELSSHPTRPNSGDKSFTKWPPRKFCDKLNRKKKMGARSTITKKDSTVKTFPLFFRVRTRNSQFNDYVRIASKETPNSCLFLLDNNYAFSSQSYFLLLNFSWIFEAK